ncbi:hypothetical protein ACFO4N_13575 [Camelliibacillus cellulosilyticus]|uniref:Regulatory protein YycH domain-containing protein n=1 Tax=Camelliibacillus cellulosilyticus TaxID=2174486 RepID=A0ABV9GNZ6_9BACL
MLPSILKKAAVVVVVLLLFVVFIQYRDYKSDHFKVDQAAFKVKDSMNAVMQEEYDAIPTLQAADRYGITDELNKDITLVDVRRNVRFKKIWLAPGQIYVLYSMNLLKTDQSFKEVPRLEVGKIIFHRLKGKDFTADTKGDTDNPQLHAAPEVYLHRVYQRLVNGFNYNLPLNVIQDNHSFQKDYLDQVDAVTLSDVQVVVGKKKIPIDDVRLPASFHFDKYFIKSIPINRMLHLKGTTVQFNNYKKYFDHSELDFTASHASDTITGFNADIEYARKTGANSMTQFFNLGMGKIYLADKEANKIVIHPREYNYELNQPQTFKVDAKTMKALLADPTKKVKIGKVLGGNVSLSLVKSPVGSAEIHLSFAYSDQKYPHLASMDWMTSSQIEAIPKEERALLTNTHQEIDFVNGKGRKMFTVRMSSEESSEGQDTYIFGMDRIDWFEQSGMTITLKSLVYVDKITADPIAIDLK